MQDATMRGPDAREAARVFGPSRWWSAAARQRFIETMQPVIGLRHPNLVSTLAISERGDTVVIFTRDVIGATLKSVLAAEPVQSIAAIASILTQVASALGHAHAAGVAHGAICSSCVVIDQNGDAMVADVGVAAAIAAAGVHGDIADSASPAYMSPEILRGERPSPSSDQYALGALAYEMLAGRGPLDTPGGWLHRVRRRWRPDPKDLSSPDVPEEWSQAVKRMLEKRPANRFASVSDAVRVFARASAGQDQRFRGPLQWIVKQQLSGAMPLEDDALPDAEDEAGWSPFDSIDAPIVDVMDQRLRNAVRRHSPGRRRTVGARGRPIIAAACVLSIGALAWSAMPQSTVNRLRRYTEYEMSQLWNPPTSGSTITAAPRAIVPDAPSPAARQPVESLPPAEHRAVPPPPAAVEHRAAVTPPPRHSQAAFPARTSAPRQNAARTLHPETRPQQRVESRASVPPPAPVVVVVTPIGTPPDTSPPSTPSSPSSPAPSAAPVSSSILPASTSAAAPSAVSPESVARVAPPMAPRVLSAADASNAARKVIDALRTASVRSLTAAMVPSKANEVFVTWLGRRPIDLSVGAPPAPRVAPTPDGGAQVRYAVPITWTHASGARPTRTAIVVVAVRPTAEGATLTSWTLAQPFVP